MNFLRILYIALIATLVSIDTAYSQTCSCTVPSGISGFANCITVTNTSDPAILDASGPCDGSLRWAMLKANTNTGGTYIKFDIPGTGRRTIKLNMSLPQVTKKIYIDGSSQSGYSPSYKDPLIELVPNILYELEQAFILVAGSQESFVKGFRIAGFAIAGIHFNMNPVSGNADISIIDNIIYDIGVGSLAGSCIRISSWDETYDGFLIQGNILGTDKTRLNLNTSNTTRGVLITGLYAPISNIIIRENHFFYMNGLGVSLSRTMYGLIEKNIFEGNITNIGFFENANNLKSAPSVTGNTLHQISGTSSPNDVVQVYFSNEGGKDAVGYIGSATADGSGNWYLNRAQWIKEDIDLTSGTKVNAIATDTDNNTSRFSPAYTIIGCAKISASLPAAVCYGTTPIPLSAAPAGGTFSGPGVSGNNFTPSVAGKGRWTITYTIGSPMDGCPASVSKEVTVLPEATYKDRILSATANIFSDNWSLEYNEVKNKEAIHWNEFTNSSKGIWKLEELYVYTDHRAQSGSVNLKQDGVMNNVPLFNWNSALNGGCAPNWRKINTVTAHSPYSFETENKDILNVYSAAVYSYKGSLATAVAANANNDEIAFEGFEEYNTGNSVTFSVLGTGNFIFFTSTSEGYAPGIRHSYIEVESAVDNKLTLVFPFARASEFTGKTVRIFGSDFDKYANKSVYGSFPVVAVAQGDDAGRTVVTIDPAKFSYTGMWKGKIKVPYALTNPVMEIGNNLQIASHAHTGKRSLKVSGTVAMEQHSLQLIPARKYLLSCWISANNTDTYSFRTTSVEELNKRSVEVYFMDDDGNYIASSVRTEPDDLSQVIEGWQKMDLEFTMPLGATRVVVKLVTPATDPTYIDDIRIFPWDGNIQTYVYNKENLKLSAVLDQNNYATLYYYDEQGNLYMVKKETERGIHTIQEVMAHPYENHVDGE